MTYTGRIRVKPLFRTAAFIPYIGVIVVASENTRGRPYRIRIASVRVHIISYIVISIFSEKKERKGNKEKICAIIASDL